MNYNNKIIVNNKMQSILICENKLYKFYKKFLWSNIDKESIELKDYETKKNFMGFNFKAKQLEKKIKLTLFFNK